jgi:hypothetical protein
MDSRSALDGERKTASLALLSSTLTTSKSTYWHALRCPRVVNSRSSRYYCQRANPLRSSYSGPMKARTAVNKDMATASGDSSTDEEVEHPSAAPAPDAEIAYSYDAHRGPSHGSQILNHALEKAVERFETKETEKLVKNEYEVLDREDDEAPRTRRLVAPEDEEYEFIDA